MGEGSRIGCDLDWDADGKQIGRLRVPYSRNRSAWGSVQVPIAQIKRGEGPTVLLTAGAHGDEYEGPLALSQLVRDLDPANVSGRVIVVPGMNLPALRESARLCPIDGLDLNRSFPGDRSGTYTKMLAHFVATELVPRADAVLDMHSGGYSLWFLPCVFAHHLDDPEMNRRTMEAMRAFGAPLGMVVRELDDAGQLDTYVERQGILFLSTELAGGGQVTPEAVRVGNQGAWNLLAHFGVVPSDHPKVSPRKTERIVEVPAHDCYVLAPDDGVFEPFAALGSDVREGDPVGQLVFLEDLTRAPVPLVAKRAGTLVCKRAPGRTECGDTLFVIAEDLASPG